jgi:hypothetical protein
MFENIMDWIKGHWSYLLIAGLLVYFIYTFFFKDKKPKIKPFDRSEEERKRFKERMKLNYTEYKGLWRGGVYLGLIKSLRFSNLNPTDKKEDDRKFVELVYKPPLINLFLFKIHFFTKEICVLVNTEDVRRDSIRNEINISALVTFDRYLGIYYDRKYANEFSKYIQIDSQFRTDLENVSAFYYAKAQEQSVIIPEHAHSILKEEIKLQQEQEKRARATEGNV